MSKNKHSKLYERARFGVANLKVKSDGSIGFIHGDTYFEPYMNLHNENEWIIHQLTTYQMQKLALPVDQYVISKLFKYRQHEIDLVFENLDEDSAIALYADMFRFSRDNAINALGIYSFWKAVNNTYINESIPKEYIPTIQGALYVKRKESEGYYTTFDAEIEEMTDITADFDDCIEHIMNNFFRDPSWSRFAVCERNDRYVVSFLKKGIPIYENRPKKTVLFVDRLSDYSPILSYSLKTYEKLMSKVKSVTLTFSCYGDSFVDNKDWPIRQEKVWIDDSMNKYLWCNIAQFMLLNWIRIHNYIDLSDIGEKPERYKIIRYLNNRYKIGLSVDTVYRKNGINYNLESYCDDITRYSSSILANVINGAILFETRTGIGYPRLEDEYDF